VLVKTIAGYSESSDCNENESSSVSSVALPTFIDILIQLNVWYTKCEGEIG